MSVKLLTEHHLEFISLKGGCTGSPESTLVKMPHSRLGITCHGSNVTPNQCPDSIQWRATLGPPAKRHSNDVSLAADGGPLLYVYW